MSQTIDNRIVEMQFENKQFESGVQESLSTLDKLKKALKFDDASQNLTDFSKNINKNMDLSGLSKSVESLSDKFSASGIAGMEMIRKLTDFAIEAGKTIMNALDAPFKQIREGGWSRAMNIEDAKFQLKGLGITWESVFDDIDYAVSGTAYGLDAAAKACSQLSASGVKAGEDMKAALRGISGVAAMGNTEYENISRIFTKVAGNGKAMAMELNQISQYGLNARASLAKFFNAINEGDESVANIPEKVKKRVKAITEGAKVTEASISEFASNSKIDFETFSYAMDSAFGEHAKAANETFMGSLRNIKAALSKIGAEFATPIIHGAIPVFNQIRIFLNDLKKQLLPVAKVFENITNMISDKLTKKLEAMKRGFDLGGFEHLGNALRNVFTSIVKIITVVVDAFHKVFPPMDTFEHNIISVTKGIENFSKKLIISDDALIKFSDIMVTIFSILKSVGSIIKTLLPVVGRVAGIALNIISVVAKLISYLVTFVTQLDFVQNAMEGIQKAGGIFAYAIDKVKTAFGKLHDILTDTSTVTGRFAMKLKDIALTIVSIVGGALYLGFLKIKEVFEYFNTKDPLGSLITGIQKLVSEMKQLPFIKDIVHGIEVAFGAVTKVVIKVGDLVKDFISDIKSGMTVLQAFGNTLKTIFGGAVELLSSLVRKIKDIFSSFGNSDEVIKEEFEMPMNRAGFAMDSVVGTLEKGKGAIEKTSASFNSAKKTIVSFAGKLWESIKKIDTGKVLLFAFGTTVIALSVSLIKLSNAITGVAKVIPNFINKFSNFLTNFGKKSSSFYENMLGIALGLTALAGAIYVMSKIDSTKLQQITVSLGALIAVMGIFSVVGTKTGGAFAAAMASFASGIVAMVGALYVLDSIKWQHLEKDALVLLGIVTTMIVVSAILSRVAPTFSKGGLAVVAFAGSIYILAKALEVISNANLENIKNSYKELSIIILMFAAFAATASNVGIAAALGLLSFIAVLKLLEKNTKAIETGLSTVKTIFYSIAEEIKATFKYFYESLKKVSEAVEKSETLGKVIQRSILAIIGIIVAIGIAGKGIKKAAVGITLIIASIAGLMFLLTKIAQISQNIKPEAIDNIRAILDSIFSFIGVLSVLFLSKELLSLVSKKKQANDMLKDVRKILTSFSVLLVALSLFMSVVSNIPEDNFDQAVELLESVEKTIAAIAIVCTVVTAVASKSGKAEIGFKTFAGITLLIGAMIGSIAVLMYMFSSIDWNKDAQMLITAGAAFTLITLAIIGILLSVAQIEKAKPRKTNLTFAANVAALTAMIGIIGGLAAYMSENLNSSQMATVGGIALAAIAMMVAVIGLVVWLQKESTKFGSGRGFSNRMKALKMSMVVMASMIGEIVALAFVFNGLKNIDAGKIWGQATALTFVVGALAAMAVALQKFSKDKATKITDSSGKSLMKTLSLMGMLLLGFGLIAAVMKGLENVDGSNMVLQAGSITLAIASIALIAIALQKFSKDSKISITQTSGKSLQKTLALMGTLLLAFGLLAVVFYGLRDVDGNKMAIQAASIGLVLLELAVLAGAMIYFCKVTTSGWQDIAKGAAIIGAMIVLFGALAGVFWIINGLQTEGILAKSETIVLVLLELAVLGSAMGLFFSKFQDILAGGLAGEAVLAGMVGIFYLISKVFKVIDGIDGTDLMGKSHTIVLVMAELIALITAMGALVQYASGLFAVGGVAELALWPMIALFGMLADVFVVIDGLKTEGIMKKSQTIILVMTELIALISAMGGLIYAGGVSLLGGIAELALWPMILLFDLLADVFVKINNLKTEGIMAKSQTIILVMTELIALIALMGGLVYAAGIGLIGGLAELALWPMILLFGLLADVFVKIDAIKTEGIMAKSQTMVLVLLELEGLIALLGVLAPLALLALAGMPGLLGCTLAMNMIANALAELSSVPVDQIQGTVDVLVGALWSLMGIGVSGVAAGPGLLLIAAGIGALGLACGTVSVALMAFSAAVLALSAAITTLVATGPGILSWFTSVAMGVTTLATSIMTAITGLSVSVVVAINTLVIGIVSALTTGGAMIFAAAAGIGKRLEDGLKSTLQPKLWGSDFMNEFANGINSGISKVINAVRALAQKIRAFLHFTTPDEGPLSDANTWMPDMMSLFGGGISGNMGKVLGPVGDIASGIKDKLSNIDLKSVDWSKALNVAGAAASGNSILDIISQVIGGLGLLKQTEAEAFNAAANRASMGSRGELLQQYQAEEKQLKKNLEMVSHYGGATAQSKEKVNEMTKALSDNKKNQEQLLGITNKATNATDKLGNEFGDLEEKAKGGGGGVAEAKDEIADFYDMISSSINLFEEFNTQTDLTSDKLLENMRSQINGMVEWSGMIAKLATMGIDQGLLKQLADMGPQGYQYTKAFVNMTADQIAEASHLYQQSLQLPSAVTAHVYSSFAYAGQQSAQGFFNGLNQESVRDQGVAFAKELLAGVEGLLQIHSPSRVMYEDGANTGLGFVNGLGSNAVMSILTGTCNRICRTVRNLLSDGLSPNKFFEIGQGIAQGLEDGLKSKEGDLKSAITGICNTIKSTAKSKKNLDINSPSRAFAVIGSSVVEGLAKGITDNVDMAVDAIGMTSTSMIDQMRETINKANEALIDDIEDPVIKPVLDLTDIESGSRTLNDMLSRDSAFSAGKSFTTLQNGQWDSQNALLNATMDNTDIVSAINSMKDDINTLKDAMLNTSIVLDTGTMVGAMTPAIDQQMGMRQVYAGRGI